MSVWGGFGYLTCRWRDVVNWSCQAGLIVRSNIILKQGFKVDQMRQSRKDQD